MTKATYIRSPTGFTPADDGGRKYWQRFGLGDEVLLTFTVPRSLPQLRLYWALVEIAYQNNRDMHVSEKETSDSIKLACGLTETTNVKYRGEWFKRKIPASIAFENMPQDEFNAFFERALAYICEELVPGLDVETLEQEVRSAA